MIIDKEIEKFSNANQMITGTERLTNISTERLTVAQENT
jgi:hypothetical protein